MYYEEPATIAEVQEYFWAAFAACVYKGSAGSLATVTPVHGASLLSSFSRVARALKEMAVYRT
jgi:hypothetical protein